MTSFTAEPLLVLGDGRHHADKDGVRRYPTTPLWVRLGLAAVLLGSFGWWAFDRADRLGNQHRLEAIASAIAGREVKVRCPGPLGRTFFHETLEGSVRFSAAGRPANDTQLRATSCAELDALAEGRRAKELACTERAGILCGRRGAELAMAVDVITHESFHLRGIQDEASAECSSLQTMAQTAERLGATPAQGAALARGQYAEGYPRMPDRYRSPHCAEGGAFDLRPDDPRFP
jgi:hypothetical protein